MDSKFPNNIYIFNLCEFPDMPLKTVIRIFDESGGETIDKDLILSILGNTPTCHRVCERLEEIDVSFLSLYSLLAYGVNQYIIEKLRESFKDIGDLYEREKDLHSFSLQSKTLEKISDFLYDFLAFSKKDSVLPRDVILSILAESQKPIRRDVLFNLVMTKENNINLQDFNYSISELLAEKLLKITSDGIEIKRLSIDDFFSQNINDKGLQILYRFIKGENIQVLGDAFNVSRQRIDQIIKKERYKVPILDNENRYKEMLEEYKLSEPVMERLGFTDKNLIKFINLKYSLNPTKDDLDYVLEYNSFGQNLVGTDLGNFILQKNNRVCIDGKIVFRKFKDLFLEFVSSNNLFTFNADEIFAVFKEYLATLNSENLVDNLDIAAFKRKIENTGSFLNCGSSNYYWFVYERFNQDFLDASRSYLENFYGYGSVESFLNDNKTLCNENFIFNEYQLFSVFKRLFEAEFKEDIEFIRMPTISTKGVSREDFLLGVIDELQPISVNDFISHLNSKYGLKKESIYANFLKFINNHVNTDGLLTTNEEVIDKNDPDYEKVLDIIGDRKVLPLKEYITNIKKELPNRASFFTSKTIIRKLGYSYRNDSIYKNVYNSLNEALINLSNDLPITVSDKELLKYLTIDNIDSRSCAAKQDAIFLKFSDNLFLNVSKRIDRNYLLRFRDEIIDNLVPDQIYTINSLLNSSLYNNISTKYKEAVDLFDVMNVSLLINLLHGSTKITSLETRQPFVFGKGSLVSNKRVIKTIVNERGVISKDELFDVLKKEYGIYNEYYSSSFFELGLYFNSKTNKVYSNKELCDKELQDYLNMEE